MLQFLSGYLHDLCENQSPDFRDARATGWSAAQNVFFALATIAVVVSGIMNPGLNGGQGTLRRNAA